jgi:hypothetical protein
MRYCFIASSSRLRIRRATPIGGAKLRMRTVVDDNGEEHVIIEWAYYDGTFDWYDYKKGNKQ